MERRDPLIAVLNRLIDKHFHKYFDNPDACVLAIGVDAILHQYFESMFGLSRKEIARRTARYLPKAIERCINAKLGSLWRDIK